MIFYDQARMYSRIDWNKDNEIPEKSRNKLRQEELKHFSSSAHGSELLF